MKKGRNGIEEKRKEEMGKRRRGIIFRGEDKERRGIRVREEKSRKGRKGQRRERQKWRTKIYIK